MKNFKKAVAALTTGAMTLSIAAGSAAMFGAVNAADISKMTAVELVEDMGTGWNLGNSFDCTNTWTNPLTIEAIETAWGNPVTTKSMIDAIAFYGIDTVRVPVTWMQMTDDNGNISTEYLARVKEVVDYCYANDMYVILNMHHDGLSGNWLNAGLGAKDRFTSMWTQIATYFKDYDRHLVFEGWNEIEWDYSTNTAMGQAFVDAVRAVGGGNADRLLVIPGVNTNYKNTVSSSYVMPQDAANMLAVDIHYYDPTVWTVYSDDDDPWGWGMTPQNTWGSDEEIATVKNDIGALKSRFTDQGYGVLIGEYGVENYNKDEDDRMLFSQTVASAAYDATGICACLWDSSNGGDMKYFDRKTQSWLNASMGEFYKSLTGGTYEGNDDLILTDRVTITGTKDKDGAIVWDLEPYKDKAVLKEAIWTVIPEGLTSAGYYGLVAAQANVLEDTVTNPTTSDYKWAFNKTSIANESDVYITNLKEWYYDDNGEDALFEGHSMVYDYFKLACWYVGSDGTAPTIDFSPDLTLVFEEPIWVSKDTNIPENPDETDAPTDAPTDEPTDDPNPDVIYGDVNDDGSVTIVDVVMLCRYAMGAETVTDQGKINADVDMDGKADATDASYIIQSLVNLITLPVKS